MSKTFNMKLIMMIASLFMGGLTIFAQQLNVTVFPPKVTGQKTIVSLAITNNLAESVESARAICFLMDDQGKMFGQSSKWVIGGTKDRPSLISKEGTTFNFVITSPQPFATTNLIAKISFSRVVLAGGRLADIRHAVTVTTK